jgi:tRNA pseudouridine13 synthase
LFQSGQENKTDASETAVISYVSQIESFKSLAGDSDASRLEEFINQINAGGEDGLSPIILSPDSDKSHRTVSMSLRTFLFYFRFWRHMIRNLY